MNRVQEHKRAQSLNGLDARKLIQATYPALPHRMTADQLDHLQRVLDVAAVNASVDAEYEELDRKSIKGVLVGSNQYLRDPAKAAQAKRC